MEEEIMTMSGKNDPEWKRTNGHTSQSQAKSWV
jgi:hypothetical protein